MKEFYVAFYPLNWLCEISEFQILNFWLGIEYKNEVVVNLVSWKCEIKLHYHNLLKILQKMSGEQILWFKK